MKGKVTIGLDSGKYEMDVEGKDAKEVLFNMASISDFPKCYDIKDGYLSLEGRKVTSKKDGKKYVYVNIVCKGQNASGKFSVYKSELGTYLDNGGFFWKKFEKDEYAEKQLKEQATEKSDRKVEEETKDEIPF